MAKIRVTVKVEIEQSNGDYSKFERTTEDDCTDNPLYFAHYAEQVQERANLFVMGAVKDRFGDHS